MKSGLLLLCAAFCISSTVLCRTGTNLINFSHLAHLTERISFDGDSVDIVRIYSNYPSYDWSDAGNEGIACVDDAARAAILYIRYYDDTKDTSLLARAKSLIRFVQHMETDDGMFYNFIRADHSINRDGKTSFKSFGWWGVRALWCFAEGYRVFLDRDSAFALELKSGIEKTFPHIDSLLHHYRRFRDIRGFRTPSWLLYESGADVTSALILGLSEYYEVSRDPKAKSFIQKFAAGLIAMQNGSLRKFPYGLHRSWETLWHMWGNDQTNALARAAKLFADRRMFTSAELEARGFYSRLLMEGFRKEIDVTSESLTQEYDQIAYCVRPMVSGLLRLYDATHTPDYLTMAGVAASWFFGNNPAHQVMYDSSTGICFDGIRDSSTVNKNSGAESTIEALWSLVELQSYPQALVYLDAKKIDTHKDRSVEYAVFETSAGEKISLILDLRQGSFKILKGDAGARFHRTKGRR